MTRPSGDARTWTVCALLLALLLPGALTAQDGPNWERRSGATETRTSVFSSTNGVNLPTAETLGAGELLFEISHRFTQPVSSGSEQLWGLDGGVFLRLGLSWAPTDRLMLGVVRSNYQDNLDLGAKLRIFESSGGLPVAVAVSGGWAINTQDDLVPDGESRSQTHVEAIVDVGLGERVQIGIVPGMVTNPLPEAAGEDASVFVGTHARLELNDRASLIGEWVFAPERGTVTHDMGAVGIELETGGHFFKFVVGNSFRLNPAQAFIGADDPFGLSDLRFGFNITRVLRF